MLRMTRHSRRACGSLPVLIVALAFVAAVVGGCGSDSPSDPQFSIYVAALPGGDPQKVASGVGPSWTADGSGIAFVRVEDGVTQTLLIDRHGSNARVIATSQSTDGQPRPSPDGSRYVFPSDRSGATQLYLMDHDGGNVTPLVEGFSETATGAWSPDGSKIAYAARSLNDDFDILVRDIASGRVTQLTDDSVDEWLPSRSADGARIAFQKGPTCLAANASPSCSDDIYTMNSDGSEARQLTGDGVSRFPSWTPDGRIAFTSRGLIYIMEADGTGSRLVVGGENYLPSVSPDGSLLLYVHLDHPRKGAWNPFD